MAKEKERQYHVMATRIRKLSIDQERADRQLRKTLDFHDQLEAVKKRKEDDLKFKAQWLDMNNQEMLEAKIKNEMQRTNGRNNVDEMKRKIFVRNWHTKQRTKNELNKQFEIYSQHERNLLQERDQKVQQLYLAKRKAR